MSMSASLLEYKKEKFGKIDLYKSNPSEIYLLQADICNPDQLSCVNELHSNSSECKQKCEGLSITSYTKYPLHPELSSTIGGLTKEYNDFKGLVTYPLYNYKISGIT